MSLRAVVGRARRACVASLAVVVLAGLLGACAHSSAQPPVESSAPSTSSPAPSASSASRAPSPSGASAASAPTTNADVVAARRAFDRWLAAYVASDAVRMITYSMGAAASLGSLQLATDSLVVASGGSVRASVTKESIADGTISGDTVTFGGSVGVKRDVHAARNATINDTIAGPIEVVRKSNAWRVSTFMFDGASLRSYVANTDRTIDGVRLNLAFVLSNAHSTTAVVSVYSPDSFAVSDARLVRATGAIQTGRSYFAGSHPTGVIVFPRTEDAPARLDLTVTRGSKKTSFSLAIPRA